MKIKYVMLLFFVVGLPGTAWADNVQLKSGKTYQGEISSHTATELDINTQEGLIHIPFRMIESIEADPETQTSSYPMFDEVKAKVEELGQQEEKRNLVYGKEGHHRKVELYMTSWCPYCRKMEMFLQKNKIDYVRYNIEYDKAAHDRYKKMRGNGVPLIKIGDTIIRGYDPSAVSRAVR